MARTKIVCTIGPASRSRAGIAGLAQAGMDVARLNFSHGTHAEHAEVVETVRAVSAAAGRPIAILQDLAGVKIRIGEIAGGPVRLEGGASFTLTSRPVPGDAQQVSVSVPDLPRSVAAGDAVLLSDGELQLRVEATDATDVRCRVVAGGLLSSHKGISLPRSRSGPGLTAKDREDLRFGVAQGVDYVALSFVRTADDVHQARGELAALSADIPLVAKIENADALSHIDAILAASDGIMVARGDLGVETPLEHVPLLQKMLIEKANRAGKPVITATQMLLSMVDNPRPTRAEVGDVANAILDGTDAVMLSEETAAGRYPARGRRHDAADRARRGDGVSRSSSGCGGSRIGACSRSPRRLPAPRASSRSTSARPPSWRGRRPVPPPVSWPSTGRDARSWRCAPPRPRRGAWRWSGESSRSSSRTAENADAMMEKAPILAAARGLVRPGEKVVITAGVPRGVSGSTNLIKAAVVPS